jgi:hypothetical protein
VDCVVESLLESLETVVDLRLEVVPRRLCLVANLIDAHRELVAILSQLLRRLVRRFAGRLLELLDPRVELGESFTRLADCSSSLIRASSLASRSRDVVSYCVRTRAYS